MNAGTLLLSVLLVGCASSAAPQPQPAQPEVATDSQAPAAQVTPAVPKCGQVSKRLLRRIAAAEGPILRAFDVSRERRAQIEEHNADKAALAAAFAEHPCLVLVP